MKTLLTGIAVLFSMSSMAQSGTIKLDSLTKYSSYAPYALRIDTAKRSNWPQYRMLNVDTKPLMTISDQRPDSSYHIWFDKKAIIMTSDSTFILKRKP